MTAKNNAPEQRQMTPVDALQILDRVASTHQGTRQDHILLQNALTVIHQALSQAGVLGEPGQTLTPDTLEETEAEKPAEK